MLSQSLFEMGGALFQGKGDRANGTFLGNHSEPSLSDYSSVPFPMVKVEFN